MNITYRPLTIEDLPLRMKWLNDPEVNKYLRIRGSNDLAFHKEWLEAYLQNKEKEIFIILADKKSIGQVGLVDINTYDKNAALYIVIGEKENQGKGIGKQAIKYILNHAFNDLDLHKVWLDVHAENVAALKCYRTCGFEEEGRYKDQVLYADGRFADEIGMAIINPKNEE